MALNEKMMDALTQVSKGRSLRWHRSGGAPHDAPTRLVLNGFGYFLGGKEDPRDHFDPAVVVVAVDDLPDDLRQRVQAWLEQP